MSDLPAISPAVLPQFISSFGVWSACRQASGAANPAPQTWVANLAAYVSVTIPWPYPVRRVWWQNGSTVTSSNADFGIYTPDGTRIYSTGSTAMSGTNAPQFVTPTAFLLDAGEYLFAWACDNTTNRAYGGSYSITPYQAGLMGLLEQTSAFALPATATLASGMTNALHPLCGVTRTPSGF